MAVCKGATYGYSSELSSLRISVNGDQSLFFSTHATNRYNHSPIPQVVDQQASV